MVSGITEDLLVSLFLSIAETEKQSEAIRQVLVEQPSFDLHSVFDFLDRKRNLYITFSDIVLFLRDEGVRFDDQEAYILLKQWDLRNEGRLDIDDLKTWILSRDYTKIDDKNDRISYEVEYSLVKIFENELFHIRLNEDTKIRLVEMPDFSLIDGFRMIDVDGLGYITPQNLAGFLQRNGIRQCEETIDGVLYRLDKDRDGNLNYTEFIDSVMPSDPRFHPKLKMRSVIDPSYTHSSLVHSSTPNKSQRTTKSPKKRPLSAKDKKSVSKSINFESPTKSKNMVQRNKARIVNSNLNVDVLRLKEKKELIALASIFKDHIILDKDLEKIKDQLALRLDFTIQDLFLHFSNSNSGSISELEFEIGLKSFKIFPQGNSFFLLFRRYDRNSDGRLDLQDFWNLFTPRACNYSHLLKSRFSSAKFRGKFSIETNELIKECFRNLFIAEESLEGMRIRLHSRPNFNASSIYELLVNPRQDYITTNEFRDVLRRANYFPTEKDLDALFSFFDTNKDGKVTYHEFTRALVPKFS